jgi:hypothetical protein
LWSGAAIQVGNNELVYQTDKHTLMQIKQNEELIMLAKANGMDYHQLQTENNRLIAGQNFDVGGGCPGRNKTKFNSLDSIEVSGLEQQNKSSDDKESWTWKRGVCRVKSCGKKTEVGPCDVCRSCQAKFDKGQDPTNQPKLTENNKEDESNTTKKFWELVNINFDKQVKVMEAVNQ